MTWIAPVTDRTQLDIASRTSKAYLNAEDLNRIEGNIEWLANRLAVYLGSNQLRTRTDWDMFGLPTTNDIKRICDGITDIKDAYFRPNGYMDIPDLEHQSLSFRDINLLERNLLLLKDLYDLMVANFKKLDFKSGTTLFLPKRRLQS